MRPWKTARTLCRSADALALQPGEAVLDIGCGAGTTTIALAARVGVTGRVLGVDVSKPLLEYTRSRAVGPTFLEADATFVEQPAVDANFSRFVVMFFADPGAAFRNLQRSLATRRGRLAFVAWRAPDVNPVMTLASSIVDAMLGTSAASAVAPRAPGLFAFAEAAYVREILAGAGFVEVGITPFDTTVPVGPNLEVAADYLLQSSRHTSSTGCHGCQRRCTWSRRGWASGVFRTGLGSSRPRSCSSARGSRAPGGRRRALAPHRVRPRLDLLGVFPDLVSLVPQLLLALAPFGWVLVRTQKPSPAAAE